MRLATSGLHPFLSLGRSYACVPPIGGVLRILVPDMATRTKRHRATSERRQCGARAAFERRPADELRHGGAVRKRIPVRWMEGGGQEHPSEVLREGARNDGAHAARERCLSGARPMSWVMGGGAAWGIIP